MSDQRVKIEKKKHKIFGRPRLAARERKSVKIAVFLSPEEAEKLKLKAIETGFSVPEILRRSAFNKQIEIRRNFFDSEALGELRYCGQTLRKILVLIELLQKQNEVSEILEINEILREQYSILKNLNERVINGE